ncbi:PH domain-containing protein [Micromonospora sp. NPDC000207]|uniref:PH domain-containing protein n=1 Tax=Micromonospora sp. NPDC000207 TaxID=3154246 RepID=UPI00332E57AE
MTTAADPEGGRAAAESPERATDATSANRWVVGVADLFAVGWVAAQIWWVPTGLASALWIGGVPYLLAVVAFGAVLLASGGGSARLGVVDLRPGVTALRAGPSRVAGWLCAGQVLLVTAITTSLVDRSRWDEGAAETILLIDLSLLVLLVAVVVMAQVVGVFRSRPRVDLTPTGVEARDLLGSRVIPWAALAPGGPLPPSGRSVSLVVSRPDLVVQRGLMISPRRRPRVNGDTLAVRVGFLADVLRYYVDHPDERAGIGTPQGYLRLRRTLGLR